MGIWTDLWRTEAKGWAFGHIGGEVAIKADKRYVSVMLRQLRIVNARVGFGRFYGTVEFYGRVPHLSGGPIEFASVTTPGQLRNIRKKDLGNFVIGTKRFLGPIPYVGGDLEIEIGLFTIKSQDLLMPYLDLIEDLSNAAGLAFATRGALHRRDQEGRRRPHPAGRERLARNRGVRHFHPRADGHLFRGAARPDGPRPV